MAPSDLAVYSALNKLLQPTETIKFASEVMEAPSPDTATTTTTRAARRCLGVISNTASGLEEAALIVFRRPSSPLITALIPIYSDFQLSISQSDSVALASSDGTATPRTRFLVTFGSSSSTRFSVIADDINTLSDLIAEVKRLQSVAETGRWTEAGTTHGWTAAYKPHDATLDGQTLARFDSISSAYSQRISSPLAMRAGLGSIDWGDGVVDSPDLREEQAAADQRGRWIVEQLQGREDEFTAKEDIKVFVGTFNVNDTLPKGADLSPWLVDADGASLLVFGFQEFDLSTEAMIRWTSYREDQWRAAIEAGLGDRAPLYEKLHARQLVGALILVYLLKSEAQHVSAVQSNSLATGIMGLMANKGATAVRLRFKDSYLCFVNSHLAAFTHQVEQRNIMVRDTSRYLGFPFEKGQTRRDPWMPNLRPELERPAASYGLHDAHHLIWLGDMNYRIELPREDVLRMIETKDWDMLLRFDQLKIQKKHELVFTDFREGPIDFAPTFKFDPGTETYDTSAKQRVPAWTDRVLWLSVHEDTIKSLSYRGHPEIGVSDHKPVSALLQVQICTIVPEKRMAVQQEVMAELDQFDNDSLPDVKLIPGPSVQFDDPVSYLSPQTMSVEIENVGHVVAQWSFVARAGTSSISSPWLHITPNSGLILPGERSLVNFTISVDSTTAPALNFKTDELSDLLILSIEKKDLFLSVAAREYKPTCFANSLDRLSRLEGPIRSASDAELNRVVEEEQRGDVEGAAPRKSVVQPVYLMLGWLSEFGLEQEDLFLVPGDPELVDLVRECLDTGDDFPLSRLLGTTSLAPSSPSTISSLSTVDLSPDEGGDIGSIQLSPTKARFSPTQRPEITAPSSTTTSTAVDSNPETVGIASVADCFLRWLEALPEPVVSYRSYSRALRVEKREDAYVIVRDLSDVSANTLLYIVAFLRVLLSQTKDSTARAARLDRLAVVFSHALLRPDPSATPDALPLGSVPWRRKQFMLLLLAEDTVDTSETVPLK